MAYPTCPNWSPLLPISPKGLRGSETGLGNMPLLLSCRVCESDHHSSQDEAFEQSCVARRPVIQSMMLSNLSRMQFLCKTLWIWAGERITGEPRLCDQTCGMLCPHLLSTVFHNAGHCSAWLLYSSIYAQVCSVYMGVRVIQLSA